MQGYTFFIIPPLHNFFYLREKYGEREKKRRVKGEKVGGEKINSTRRRINTN